MLKNKVAIVTGASKGVGFEIAKQFAARGAVVIVCSRSMASAQKSTSLITGKAYPERLDVTDLRGLSEFVRGIAERHGRIDILVNNAGYPFDRNIWNKRFHEVPNGEFDKVIEVDLKGTLRLSQAAIPYMIRNGNDGGGGVIINIASTPAIAGHTAGAPYSIAKAGVIAITKHIALEYGDKNIRAYALAFANISAEATLASMTPPERKKAAIENSMKRGGHPQEVSRIAANLASEDFAFATGTIIVIDRGMMML